MKKLFVTIAAVFFCGVLLAQEQSEKLDSVVISATRAWKHSPITYSSVDKETLSKSSSTNSVPMVLNLLPSVVTYTEGGNGLGNSIMTIRGSKGSQINVTLNGITLNDAESQEVFWVNIPALSSIISSVQLQRGLGTTAGGSGSFGASVNMSTASVSPGAFGAADFSIGSWNTYQTTVYAGTGLTGSGFYLNSAFSYGTTDGYIRNGFVNSKSGFLAAGWMGERNSLRFTYLLGDQKSGITWDGIDPEQYRQDRRQNKDNQTDNYTQHHLQFNWTHVFGHGLTLSNTINYTRGSGYDEYYGQDSAFEAFGFAPEMTGTDGQTWQLSDMIYRKMMANDYYLAKTDLTYKCSGFELAAGASLSQYVGNHFGRVLWAKVLGQDWNYGAFNDADSWYRAKNHKLDGNVFARAEYFISENLTAYADLQYRFINYKLKGKDEDYPILPNLMDYRRNWNFFNPRAGLSWNISHRHRLYGSVAVGHREPGRSDIKENIKGTVNPIKPERMTDYEFGYVYSGSALSGSATLYFMEYKDILLETGRLSTEGYALKENVPTGWRRGLELAAAWKPSTVLRIDANATLSTNKIKDYVAYVPYVDYSGQQRIEYGTSTMLLSPSLIGMGKVSVSPWADATVFSLSAKYVGKQYIDNTQRDIMAIPARCVLDFTASKELKLKRGVLGVSLYINNILNHKYFASGWRYELYDPATSQLISYLGIYPQPTTNFTIKLSYRF